MDDLFRALGDETRRAVITQLNEQGPTQAENLADDRDQYRRLYHLHLPLLADAGIIRQKDGLVRPGPKFQDSLRLVERKGAVRKQ